MMPIDRLPEIPRDKMNAAQKQAYDEIASGPRGAVYGPFVPLLRSPELMRRLQKTGEYLRYQGVLPQKLSELATLIVAREWTQQFEWHHHHALALERGLKPALVQAIAEGRRPSDMSEDEEIIYEICAELHHNKRVSDETYGRALTRFGEQSIIELIVLQGYYTLMAMVMNVARTALPEGTIPPLSPFPL
jgi:4-carboxymuconolactone decarboxylase